MVRTWSWLSAPAVLALALGSAQAESADTPEMTACMAAIQGKIAQSPTDPDAKTWPEDDLRHLCRSQAPVSETIACFTELLDQTKDRTLAISTCSKLH